MATTITERVYDDLTHKLRQWEKLTPAPHEILGAIKSWTQLGNADIEAAANAAAGLAVKSKDQRMEALDEAKMIYEDTRRIHTTLLRDGDVNSAHILDLARDMMSMFNRYKLRLVRPYTDEFIQWAKDTSRSKSSNDSAAMLDAARKVVKVLANPKNFIPQPARSVKAFANVPDVPAALAHLRTAHAAIKAQVEAERSAPPRDGGFAGVKAAPVDTARVQKLYNALRKIETLRQMTPRDIQALDKIGMAYAFASNEARNAGNKPVQQALMEASFAITTAYTAYSKGNNGTGNTKLAQARMFTDRALQLLRGA